MLATPNTALAAAFTRRAEHAAALANHIAATARERARHTDTLTRAALEGISRYLERAAVEMSSAQPEVIDGIVATDRVSAGTLLSALKAERTAEARPETGFEPDFTDRIHAVFRTWAPGTRVTDGDRIGVVTGGCTQRCAECSTGRYSRVSPISAVYRCTDCDRPVHPRDFHLDEGEALRFFKGLLHVVPIEPDGLMVLWHGSRYAVHARGPVRPA
jgi:hypothetical protein